ncbi:hypothetical protein D5085_04690 [Ectothiorhodospiraceae bacterium BW-2]|nr:hypothetical protein D5085_04690 [Ectothiorhodospiraceae bacterium BW-2]
MLDDNLAMDKNRIAYIASLPHGSEVIEQLTASDRAVTMWLQTGFGIEKLLAREVPDKGYLLSLLYEVRPDRRQSPLLDHLFELKFIPLKQLKLSDRELQAMSREELAELPLVKAALEGAKQQGEAYWQQLQHDQPQKAWQLQRHAVVLLGFSRLVWLGEC